MGRFGLVESTLFRMGFAGFSIPVLALSDRSRRDTVQRLVVVLANQILVCPLFSYDDDFESLVDSFRWIV